MTSANPSRRVIGLFAKQPVPGQVKTRLAAATSPQWAAAVADAFLRDLLDRLAAVPARRVLVHAPAGSGTFFANLAGDRFDLAIQREGDLGRRLAAFIGDELHAGAEAVVVLGTDSPTVPLSFIEQAFAALEQADVVLGPAADGGYYLLGCAGRLPPIFEGISWGTSRVLSETLACLPGDSWRLAVLPPWYDVDTLDDWQMLCGHLAALRRAGSNPGVPHTERLCHHFLHTSAPSPSPSC